jgi:putative FmdB family regulatory protein
VAIIPDIEGRGKPGGTGTRALNSARDASIFCPCGRAGPGPKFGDQRGYAEEESHVPIYEYQCNACGERLEAIQKISEEPLKECPHCHADALRRLVSAAAFRLKGAGWYETDFKDKKSRKNVIGADAGGAKAESSTDAVPAATAEKKAESKPAPAADKASGAD